MKIRYLLFALMITMPAIAGAETIFERQQRLQKDMVKGQKTSDLQRKQDLLKKMKSFMKDINGRIGDDSSTRIDMPIDPDRATDIKDTEITHSRKPEPAPVYVYCAADSLRLRSSADSSAQVVDSLAFAEKVRLIVKTEEKDTIDGLTAPWVMVRRDNGNEGWAFSGYLRSEKPERKQTARLDGEMKRPSGGSLSDLMVPVTGRMSSQYGYRVHPVTKKQNSFHSGIDIAAPKGTPVYAAADGIIRKSEFNRSGYGNLIVVEHEKNLSTYYGHLDERNGQVNQRVKKGDLIGRVGATGMATGPHLHFEVRKGNNALNPEEYLPR
jgi:murein DD-endopeptidase MepM/ murein hydrolase activator NlpD